MSDTKVRRYEDDASYHTAECSAHLMFQARCSVDEEILLQGIAEGAWGNLDALAAQWLAEGTVDADALCECEG